MSAFMIQPVSGDCCASPCSRSGPCDPGDNWQGCDGTEPGTVDLTITFQPSGIQETETYTKDIDFCRYNNENPGGTGKFVTWSSSLNKWRVINGTTYLASNDDLIGTYTTLSGSHDYEVSL